MKNYIVVCGLFVRNVVGGESVIKSMETKRKNGLISLKMNMVASLSKKDLPPLFSQGHLAQVGRMGRVEKLG